MKSMPTLKLLKYIIASIHLFLAVPFIGGFIIVGLLYKPLYLLAVLHVIALIIATNQKKRISPHVLGIIGFLFESIPFVGWILHLIIGGYTLYDAIKYDEEIQLK